MVRKLTLSLFLSLIFSQLVQGKQYNFDPEMLGDEAEGLDLSLYNQGLQQEGDYNVTLLLNRRVVGRETINFKKAVNKNGVDYLKPCLTLKQLSSWGIKVEEFPTLVDKKSTCVNWEALTNILPILDVTKSQLKLSVPQAAMAPIFNDLAPQTLWDEGINALLMNYSISANRIYNKNRSSEKVSDNQLVMLYPGFNIGAWRVRNSLNWQHSSQGSAHWQSYYSYAERNLTKIKSTLLLGEKESNAEVFDGFPFTGISLGTNENMFSLRQYSFAPVVKGVAKTQAQVEIRQNGYLVYSTSVPPGPFVLDNFSPSGNGGVLQVLIRESDGSTQAYTLPWQTPAIALHEGFFKYSVLAGRYRPANHRVYKAPIAEAALQYGLPKNITLYGGLLAAKHYQAATSGVGVSLGTLGAVSMDQTTARSQIAEDYQSGTRWRVRYNYQMPSLGSTLNLTYTQTLSNVYRTLSDTLENWNSNEQASRLGTTNNSVKRSTSIGLTQSIGMLGYLSLSGSYTQQFDRSNFDSYMLTWSQSFAGLTLNLSWSRYLSYYPNIEASAENRIDLWLSLPISSWLNTQSQINANYTLIREDNRGLNQQLGLYGTSLNNQLNWNIQQTQQSAYQQNKSALSGSMGMNWLGAFGRVGASYGYSAAQRNITLNVDGSLVLHSQGLTMGQTLGESAGLIFIPGAKNIEIQGSGAGIKTDYRGYAVLPNLSSYKLNVINVNRVNLPKTVEIAQGDVSLVPTQGAIVRAKLVAKIGSKAVFTLLTADKQPIAFGAAVYLAGNNDLLGIVGDEGQVYLSGLQKVGTLEVKAGNKRCQAPYQLTEESQTQGLILQQVICQ
jgi:outer membrane usher protein